MGIMFAWMAFPGAALQRPLSAVKTQASLVPAFNKCLAPNRTHGPPDLPGGTNPDGSCSPPVGSSGQLNFASGGIGTAKLSVVEGNASTSADEADVRYKVSLTDVRCKAPSGGCSGAGADYTGQLGVRTILRVTDRYNGPSEVGTVADTPFTVNMPCSATGAAAGATCTLDTTADAVMSGAVREERRAAWELGPVQVFDGGSDGVVSTNPNTLFAVQGLFIP
jgi:hypothetical protein